MIEQDPICEVPDSIQAKSVLESRCKEATILLGGEG